MPALEILGRVAPSLAGVAYVTPNAAFTAASPPPGAWRLTIQFMIDTATTVSLMKGTAVIPLNEGVPVAPNVGYTFQYDATGSDAISVQFGANCNIKDLQVTVEKY